MPIAAWLASMLVLASALAAGLARPVIAADSILVDVSPEDGTGPVGGLVTLTAGVFDGSGDPRPHRSHDPLLLPGRERERPGQRGQQPGPDMRHRHRRELQRELHGGERRRRTTSAP